MDPMTDKANSSLSILANPNHPGMIQFQIVHSIGITLACNIAAEQIDQILKSIEEARNKFPMPPPIILPAIDVSQQMHAETKEIKSCE